MKKQFGTSRFAVGVLVMIGVLAFAPTASAKNPKEVKMTIVNNKLDITTPKDGNDCKPTAENNKGCIKVIKNKKSEIYFHLIGDTKCTLEHGTKWELNAVYLGGYNSATEPDDDDFGFDSTSDADYKKVKGDFNIVNRTSGLVTTIEKSEKKLGINDLNQHEYVVWYKIEATCKRSDGNPTPWVTTNDPRARNGGTD